MIYYHHPAASVAPCLGLCDDGSVVYTAEQIEAVKHFFENHWGLLDDQGLWERNDEKFKMLVAANIREARKDQRVRMREAYGERYVDFWILLRSSEGGVTRRGVELMLV